MVTCVYAPYSLAFSENMPLSMLIFDSCINFFFLIDIFVNMLSAYRDADFKIVDSFKVNMTTLIMIGNHQTIHPELVYH
jgi:precorrin-3B methylase